jgi:hypothetical protein
MVFGAVAPVTRCGRELLVHELAHTIQQRGTSGLSPDRSPDGLFESSAESAGLAVGNSRSVSSVFPACGVGLSRAFVPPEEWDEDDERFLGERSRAGGVGQKNAVANC